VRLPRRLPTPAQRALAAGLDPRVYADAVERVTANGMRRRRAERFVLRLMPEVTARVGAYVDDSRRAGLPLRDAAKTIAQRVADDMVAEVDHPRGERSTTSDPRDPGRYYAGGRR